MILYTSMNRATAQCPFIPESVTFVYFIKMSTLIFILFHLVAQPFKLSHTKLTVLQRTLDEDCRQAQEPKQLVDEASRFHVGRQRQHSAVSCSGTLLFSSRVLRPSLFTLCSHKSGRCAVELYHASHLW